MLLFTTWETYTGSETVTIRLDVQYILYKAFGTSIVLLFIETHEQAWCCESGMIYSGYLSSQDFLEVRIRILPMIFKPILKKKKRKKGEEKKYLIINQKEKSTNYLPFSISQGKQIILKHFQRYHSIYIYTVFICSFRPDFGSGFTTLHMRTFDVFILSQTNKNCITASQVGTISAIVLWQYSFKFFFQPYDNRTALQNK